MSWSKLQATAEILGTFAIIVTLVILTMEVRQNTAALQASARDSAADSDMTLLLKLVEDPSLVLSRVDESMSDEERVKQSAYLFAQLNLRQRDWRNYQAGILDETTWRSHQAGLVLTLSAPQTRKWWDSLSSIYPDDFQTYVDGLLQTAPVSSELPIVRAFD